MHISGIMTIVLINFAVIHDKWYIHTMEYKIKPIDSIQIY